MRLTIKSKADIIFDIVENWAIELEPEVEDWLDELAPKHFGAVAFHIDRLAAQGSALRMPISRSLDDGLFELRFDLERQAFRIRYYFAAVRRIVLLTVFRKQRMNERHEVHRARDAMAKCLREGHSAEDGQRMTRVSWNEIKDRKLGSMTNAERAEYEQGYAEAKLAAEVGERVRQAREAAGFSQRELASRMGTSQAAVARLEAGGVGATLTTLQRVAAALDLELSVDLRPTA